MSENRSKRNLKELVKLVDSGEVTDFIALYRTLDGSHSIISLGNESYFLTDLEQEKRRVLQQTLHNLQDCIDDLKGVLNNGD